MNLPPLPPTGGEIGGRSVVELIGGQHRELLALADALAADPHPRRWELLAAVLSRHLSAEEQYLYPAVRAAVPGGDALADRELARDDALLRRLAAADRADGDALATAVRRHAAAVDEELLVLLGQMVDSEDLVRLGNRVEVAYEAAPTRPHPRTPSTPPWNKVVDPLLGVFDKVRDVVTGRPTRPGRRT